MSMVFFEVHFLGIHHALPEEVEIGRVANESKGCLLRGEEGREKAYVKCNNHIETEARRKKKEKRMRDLVTKVGSEQIWVLGCGFCISMATSYKFVSNIKKLGPNLVANGADSFRIL
jgi:hypothetical protein